MERPTLGCGRLPLGFGSSTLTSHFSPRLPCYPNRSIQSHRRRIGHDRVFDTSIRPVAVFKSQESLVVHGARMFKNLLLAIVFLSSILPSYAKKKEQPPDPAWAGITARGRMLAEYDAVAKHASEAVLAAHPAEGNLTTYVAKKADAGWVVAFGRLNDMHNKFLVVYQATQGASPEEFKTAQNIPPQEDSGFFYLAAKAIETARVDFQGENRPYTAAVLPAESNQLYVYVYPAQTVKNVYPLGGDVRYLISADGSTIVEKRQLHKTILEFRDTSNSGRKVVGGTHSHVLSDVPEDTDVFYVLTRKPSIPEYIGAGKHVYKVQVDGTIVLVK